MSTADTRWRFGVAIPPESEDVEPPTRDDYTPAGKWVEAFVYDCGVIELRSA